MLLERIKLESDETVVSIVRKHWWILVRKILGTVGLALLPLIVFNVALGYFTSFTEAQFILDLLVKYLPQLQFFYAAWLLLVWMMFANFWTDYYLDLWAITDRRIVAIDQRGFFRRLLSSFRLERLQDMNIEVSGVLPTLLNYGSIEAQTAGGSNEEFTASDMPNPRELKALIIKLADERQNQIYGSRMQSDGVL